jgi:hypothetical protein
MSSRELIGDAWRQYAEHIVPADAPEVQMIETRRAFYAGAIACFQGLMAMLDPGTEATEADLAKMDALDAEIKRWLADLGAGRA